MRIIFKTIILVFFCFFFINCSKKSDLKNQISITVKVIDEYTKQPRIKDTVEIRIGKPWFPMRRYVKVGQYITDSQGVVKVGLDCTSRYTFTTYGAKNAFGSTEFAEDKLKDGQIVIIEVVPPERKTIHW